MISALKKIQPLLSKVACLPLSKNNELCAQVDKDSMTLAETHISLSESSRSIRDFFESEGVLFPDSFFEELLYFLSKACTYEEEENKIRPHVIIGTNLLSKNVSSLLQSTSILFSEECIDSTHLLKRLKTALPFCNNGWRVFININDDAIQYGIIRNFNGPSGISIDDVLLSLSPEEKEALEIKFILVDVVSNYIINLKKLNATCVVDFRLIRDIDNVDSTARFLNDMLSAYQGDQSKPLTAYKKLTDLFAQKLHGSICVIIDCDYNLPDEVFSDGTFLKTPIDIYSVLAQDLNDKKQGQDISFTISAHERYHAYTGILLEMLNIDGITIVDTMGRIRAFNVFVKAETDNPNSLSGGARKRAATYISNLKNPHYRGVYFQSQDGMSFYERMG